MPPPPRGEKWRRARRSIKIDGLRELFAEGVALLGAVFVRPRRKVIVPTFYVSGGGVLFYRGCWMWN